MNRLAKTKRQGGGPVFDHFGLVDDHRQGANMVLVVRVRAVVVISNMGRAV
jgi:hypothetical protein